MATLSVPQGRMRRNSDPGDPIVRNELPQDMSYAQRYKHTWDKEIKDMYRSREAKLKQDREKDIRTLGAKKKRRSLQLVDKILQRKRHQQLDFKIERIKVDSQTSDKFLELNLNNNLELVRYNRKELKKHILKPIGECVTEVGKVKSLSFSNCQLGNDFAEGLSRILSSNTSVSKLNLSSNHISGPGIVALAAMLEVNKTLTVLQLHNQAVFPSQASRNSLLKALKKNKTLLSLGFDFIIGQQNSLKSKFLTRNLEFRRTKRKLEDKKQKEIEEKENAGGKSHVKKDIRTCPHCAQIAYSRFSEFCHACGGDYGIQSPKSGSTSKPKISFVITAPEPKDGHRGVNKEGTGRGRPKRKVKASWSHRSSSMPASWFRKALDKQRNRFCHQCGCEHPAGFVKFCLSCGYDILGGSGQKQQKLRYYEDDGQADEKPIEEFDESEGESSEGESDDDLDGEMERAQKQYEEALARLQHLKKRRMTGDLDTDELDQAKAKEEERQRLEKKGLMKTQDETEEMSEEQRRQKDREYQIQRAKELLKQDAVVQGQSDDEVMPAEHRQLRQRIEHGVDYIDEAPDSDEEDMWNLDKLPQTRSRGMTGISHGQTKDRTSMFEVKLDSLDQPPWEAPPRSHKKIDSKKTDTGKVAARYQPEPQQPSEQPPWEAPPRSHKKIDSKKTDTGKVAARYQPEPQQPSEDTNLAPWEMPVTRSRGMTGIAAGGGTRSKLDVWRTREGKDSEKETKEDVDRAGSSGYTKSMPGKQEAQETKVDAPNSDTKETNAGRIRSESLQKYIETSPSSSTSSSRTSSAEPPLLINIEENSDDEEPDLDERLDKIQKKSKQSGWMPDTMKRVLKNKSRVGVKGLQSLFDAPQDQDQDQDRDQPQDQGQDGDQSDAVPSQTLSESKERLIKAPQKPSPLNTSGGLTGFYESPIQEDKTAISDQSSLPTNIESQTTTQPDSSTKDKHMGTMERIVKAPNHRSVQNLMNLFADPPS